MATVVLELDEDLAGALAVLVDELAGSDRWSDLSWDVARANGLSGYLLQHAWAVLADGLNGKPVPSRAELEAAAAEEEAEFPSDED